MADSAPSCVQCGRQRYITYGTITVNHFSGEPCQQAKPVSAGRDIFMVSKSERFFQFPIRALNMLPTPACKVTPEAASSRVSQIIDYCVFVAADAIRSQYEADAVTLEHIGKACDLLQVSYSRPQSLLHFGKPKFPQGGETLVRVRSDIIFDVLQKRMTWRLFAVLCGIYAGIGTSKYRCLRMTYLNALAHGYSTPSGMTQSAVRNSMSRYQIRRTIWKLESRGLFVRASADGRNFYYSHRLSQCELDDAVVTKAVENTRRNQKRKTEELRNKVLAQLEQIK